MNPTMHSTLVWLGLASAFLPPALRAQEAQPRWEVGAVALGVSQQAYPGSSTQIQRVLALPYAVYRGDVLRADRDQAGLRAFRSDTFELDLGVGASLGASSQNVPARRGMDDLGFLIEAGPRLRWSWGAGTLGESTRTRWRFDLPLRAVFDLSDGAAHRGYTLEPELKWQAASAAGGFMQIGLGALVADRQFANTLYGVPRRNATLFRPAYTAKPGLVAGRLSLSVGQQLSPDWSVFAFARADSVSSAANRNSPLVDRNVGLTAGVGLSWRWFHSSQPGVD